MNVLLMRNSFLFASCPSYHEVSLLVYLLEADFALFLFLCDDSFLLTYQTLEEHINDNVSLVMATYPTIKIKQKESDRV